MKPNALEKIAYTVECFLNAARVPDGPERTGPEEWLVRMLHDDAKRQPFAIYRDGSLFGYADGKVVKSFSLPGSVDGRSIWCDGRRISLIDGQAFRHGGRLVLLGAAGLVMTLPGVVGASPKDPQKPEFEFSTEVGNSNNNNNNNNNG